MLNALLILADDSSIAGKVADTASRIATNFHVEWHYFIGQTVNFCIVAFVLYHFGFKTVLATVDERNRRIAEGLQYTEDMKKKLADAEKQHAEILQKASREAQAIVAEARETGKALIDRATQEAARQAEEIAKKGREAIVMEHEKMLHDLRREVANLVVGTTSRVLGRDLTPDERSRFAADAARDLSNN
jgi:F-type H+-transporting ATPase subunit b